MSVNFLCIKSYLWHVIILLRFYLFKTVKYEFANCKPSSVASFFFSKFPAKLSFKNRQKSPNKIFTKPFENPPYKCVNNYTQYYNSVKWSTESVNESWQVNSGNAISFFLKLSAITGWKLSFRQHEPHKEVTVLCFSGFSLIN